MLTILLNLAALLAGLVIALLGVRLLVRRLGALADAAEMACAHCGNPASALSDFTCPACKRDVRGDGLRVRGQTRDDSGGPRKGRAVVAWTVLVLVLACVVTVGIGERVSGFVVAREAESSWSGEGPLRNLRCVAVERSGGASGATPRVVGAVELLLADGRCMTLEVEGSNGERATARDASGREVFAARKLDAAAVRDWLAASVPPGASAAELDAWSAVLFREIAEQTLPIGRAASLGASFPRSYGRLLSSFSASGASSVSSGRAPWPAELLRCAVVLWPLTWLAGLAALLPARGGAEPAAAGAAAASAAGAAGGPRP